MFNWIRKLFRRRRFGLSLAPSDEQIVTLRFRKERLDAVSAGPFAPPASQTPEWQLDPRMTEVTEILLDMVDRWKTPPRLFPDAAQEAYQASLNPRASLGRVARILERDPALTMQLLKQANSVYYRRGAHCDSIRQAVARVGLDGLRDLLLTAASNRLLVVPGKAALTRRLQARAPAVAFCSRVVAELTGSPADPAFTAGLLHDVGWATGFSLLPDAAPMLPRWVDREGMGWDDIVRASHQRLGMTLAKKWDLAPTTIAAIGHHHEPEHAGEEGGPMAYAVAAGVALCDYVCFYPEQVLSSPLESPAVEHLNLKPADLAKVTSDLRLRIQEQSPAVVRQVS